MEAYIFTPVSVEYDEIVEDDYEEINTQMMDEVTEAVHSEDEQDSE